MSPLQVPARPRSRVDRAIVALAMLYAVSVAAWAALRQTPLRQAGLFEFADIFAVLWLYGPLAGLLPMALWRPRRRFAALVWLLVPLGLLAVEYGAEFLPRSGPTGEARLRVMTANLMWVNTDAAGFAAVVAREQPDVLAVQEFGMGMAGPLADALRASYPYQALAPSVDPWGLGVFSRQPFAGAPDADVGAPPGPCICQSVTLRVGGQVVQVLNAHPEPPDLHLARLGRIPLALRFDGKADEPDRRKLLRRVDSAEVPLILLGDLNTGERQPFLGELRQRLTDAHVEAGWGLGWTFPSAPVGPSPVPLVRIDYVLHSRDWRAAAEHTGFSPGSDHRYVVADLVLQTH